jgi:hypothetical protein
VSGQSQHRVRIESAKGQASKGESGECAREHENEREGEGTSKRERAKEASEVDKGSTGSAQCSVTTQQHLGDTIWVCGTRTLVL